MSAAHRIDVHQHVVPPFWAKELPNHGGDPSGPRSGDPSSTVLPQWSPESAVDFMDSQEIATAILSLTAPGIVGWDQSERREMARRVNDYTADLVAKRPDRFGNFATLPLPDVDGALSQLEYVLDTLRADGAAKPSCSCIPGCHSLRRPVSPARSSTTHSIPPEPPSSSC